MGGDGGVHERDAIPDDPRSPIHVTERLQTDLWVSDMKGGTEEVMDTWDKYRQELGPLTRAAMRGITADFEGEGSGQDAN